MKTNLNTMSRKSALRALTRMGLDAALGATCCGLFGFVFGGFGALTQDASHRLISFVGCLALFGAVAGAAAGAAREFISAQEKTK